MRRMTRKEYRAMLSIRKAVLASERLTAAKGVSHARG